MTVLSRWSLLFSIFFLINIDAWPSSQEENYGQSNENKEQKMANYLKDKEITNATLFNTTEPLDEGQRVLERVYQIDRYIKFEVGFNWTGREILCNCTTVSCGPPMVISLLEQAGYPNTCIAQSCFHKKGVLKNKDTGKWERYETLGCYGGDARTHPIHDVIEPFMCADGPHVPIRCCWHSFCNSNLTHIFDYPDPEKLDRNILNLPHRIILAIVGTLTIIAFAFYCFLSRKRWPRPKWIYKILNKKYPGESDGFPLMDLAANRFSTPVYPHPYEQLQNESGGTSIGTEMTFIDGSHPLNSLLRDLDESETFGFSSGAMGDLVQKNSFLSDVQRIEQIGQGRYGTVFKCIWKGQTVAMKVLISRYEQSYYREVSMYRSGILRHTNILQFLGNDIIEHGSALEMCMVFEYHELGSLDNYLYIRPVDVPTAAKMIYSMASGLAFLHSAMETTAQNKPAIAHRDLKSGNILVKKNLMVCISDLGLAICQVDGRIGIPKPSENDHFEIEYKRRSEKMEKCGTMRYLSPELLDDTFDCDIFECYKAADVYSLGLVMYEVCRRTITKGEPEIPYERAMPYFRQIAENGGIVGEVDFTIMKKVIVDDRERPDMCDWWEVDPILQPLTHLMVECWQEDPQARLTANNLVKSIARAAEKEGLDISQT